MKRTSLDLPEAARARGILKLRGSGAWQGDLRLMRDEAAFRLAHEAMTALPMVDAPTPLERWL